VGLGLSFGQEIWADTPAPDEPPTFEVLLSIEPIVVLAKVDTKVRTSRKAFLPSPGEVSKEPAFTEEYDHYRLRISRRLKGKLPQIFEVRVIRGHPNGKLLEEARGQEMLLVLAPDSGLDDQGRPRKTFLITHGAAHVVREGNLQFRDQTGSEAWSVQRIAEFLMQLNKQRARQRANSPEPKHASSVAVVSGENKPGRSEHRLPEAPSLRKSEPLSPDALKQAEPKPVEGASGQPK
jgi:hypothetical protein